MANAGRAAMVVSGCVSGRPSFNDSQIVPSSLELSSWKREAVNPRERHTLQQSFIFILNHLHNITAIDEIQEILNLLRERHRESGCSRHREGILHVLANLISVKWSCQMCVCVCGTVWLMSGVT